MLFTRRLLYLSIHKPIEEKYIPLLKQLESGLYDEHNRLDTARLRERRKDSNIMSSPPGNCVSVSPERAGENTGGSPEPSMREEEEADD